MNNNQNPGSGPEQAFAGALVFLFPLFALSSGNGASVINLAFLVTALILGRASWPALRSHWNAMRWVVLAFALNAAYAGLQIVFRPESHLPALERPLRMLATVSALAVVLAVRPAHRHLWRGLVFGAVLGVAEVAYQRLVEGDDRPGGLLNAITFGDLALCYALLSLTSALDTSRGLLWPVTGALAGVVGCLLSGTLGGWLALPVAAVLYVRHVDLARGRAFGALALAGAALFAVAVAIPATGLQDRLRMVRQDVDDYTSGRKIETHFGIRLELWKGAAIMAGERPLTGFDGDWRARMTQLVAQRRLHPSVLTVPHLHNDALQVLITGGLLGVLAWFATLAAPFAFFLRAVREAGRGNRTELALALSGLLLVSAYFCFGLTEVIFWSVGGSLFYALMVFLLMGFCLNAKENNGK